MILEATGWSPHPDLAALVAESGPVATVMATRTDAETFDAEGIRALLVAEGVPEGVTEALQEALSAVAPENRSALAVADRHGLLHLEALDRPEPSDFVRWDNLPSLIPVLRHRGRRLSHVLAVVTPAGTDIGRFDDALPEMQLRRDAGDVAVTPVRRWAEVSVAKDNNASWKETLVNVAEQTARVAQDARADAVLVVADHATAGLLNDLLCSRTEAEIVKVVGDGQGGSTIDRVDDALEGVRRRRQAATVEQARQALREGQAVEGAEAVVRVLREGKAAGVLAAGGGDRRAWITSDRTSLALDSGDFEAEEAVDAPVVDACVAVALTAGTPVRSVADDTFADDLLAFLS